MKHFTNPHAQVRQAKALALWKFTFLLLLTVQVRANDGYAQNTVTLTEKNVPINRVLKKIQRQTGYTYFAPVTLLQKAKHISIDVKDVSITYALDKIFESQPLTYKIVQKVIIVQERGNEGVSVGGVSINAGGPNGEVRGRVTNSEGEPIEGANVMVRGTKKVVSTNSNGEFVIENVAEGAEIEVSFVGYEKRTVVVKSGVPINTSLAISSRELDAAIIQGYGKTTKRLNTGNIAKVEKEVIERQPVLNPLAVLEGRVAGMEIVQSSGTPGAGFKVLIRGNTSIGAAVITNLPVSNDPLFIIDGVPYAPNNTSQTGVTNFSFGGSNALSPFANINPGDIESIEVLKDADATAIYGSRGANGVILITTKRGREGKTKVHFRAYGGISKAGRYMEFLNTEQYLKIRREAFTNDALAPTSATAPDLLLFDSTRYTDYAELFGRNASKFSNYQVSVSGGTKSVQFFFSTGYNKEGVVYPADPAGSKFFSKRLTVNTSLNYASTDNKVNARLTVGYSTYNGRLTDIDPGTRLDEFAPNFPSFIDSAGNLLWAYKGYNYSGNPLANLYQKYIPDPDNLISSLQLEYKILNGLTIRSNFGYNLYQLKESRLIPTKSRNPTSAVLNSSEFSQTSNKSWIIEPQIEYVKNIKTSRLQVLLGSTFQQNTMSNSFQSGKGFLSDDLLGYLGAVTDPANIVAKNSFSQYKYMSVFGRINFNVKSSYILNLSGRRDGSSRFGVDNRFGNFGAVGAAWIFSNTHFISKTLPFLSYGKLRASYGLTGNDKVGDYRFLDTWSFTTGYQNSGALSPTALFNGEFGWENNRKFETSVELGFLKDRILMSVTYYRNRTDNQLLNYKLPTQTGFPNVIANFPATVENNGIELELNTTNIKSKNFTWRTEFNIARNNNKLIDFPNLENSTYNGLLIIGQPLTFMRGYHLLGVNPQTGVYEFEDVDKNGTLDTKDFKVFGNAAPKYFGGFNNTVTFRRFNLSFFFTFKKQVGPNYLSAAGMPARFGNNPPAYVWGNYWQKPGDVATLQRMTVLPSSEAYKAANTYLPLSDGIYGDASYIRLKNVFFSYSVNQTWIKKIRAEEITFYVQAQNLLTITNYKGNDPENLSFVSTPPLRTFTAGFNVNF